MKRSCVHPPSSPGGSSCHSDEAIPNPPPTTTPSDDPLQKLVEEAIRRSIRDQKKLLHAELSTGPSLKKCPRNQSTHDAALAARTKQVRNKTTHDAALAARTRQAARSVMSDVLSEVVGAAAAAEAVPPTAPSVSDDDEDMDWDVIDADTIQIANDEVLARACELMGSALFDSAISEDDSKPVAKEEGDGPNPGTLYATQLRQLEEVGLLQRYSKSRCIDVLERLNAANVGSGEMGAISVEKVVEILLKEE